MSACHEWLLGDDVDILPQLLLPLAGGEEFNEEDTEKLPLDLQYLPKEQVHAMHTQKSFYMPLRFLRM